MIVVIFYVNVILYDFCHNKIMYMFVIVYLLFVFANELQINALWRGKKGGGGNESTNAFIHADVIHLFSCDTPENESYRVDTLGSKIVRASSLTFVLANANVYLYIVHRHIRKCFTNEMHIEKAVRANSRILHYGTLW